MSGRYVTEIVERKTSEPLAQTALKQPGRYKVVLLNDDFTPMPFVVDVLQRFFYMTLEVATGVMLEVHFRGKGLCGVFTHEIAETKVALVVDYTRAHEHPLMCSMEAE